MSHPLGLRTDSASGADSGPLFRTLSSSSSRSDASIIRSRTTSSHSLLGASGLVDLRRKAQIETNTTPTDKAQISMPHLDSQPGAEKILSLMATSRSPASTADDLQSPSSPTKSQSTDSWQIHVNCPPRHLSTTAMDTRAVVTAVSGSSHGSGIPVLAPSAHSPHLQNSVESSPSSQPLTSSSEAASSSQNAPTAQNLKPDPAFSQAGGVLRHTVARSNPSRSISAQRRVSTPSQRSLDIHEQEPKNTIGTIGVCALDVKARSRPSRQILTRLQGDNDFEVVVFGDKAILDEDVKHWPICDFLIAFFSDGFPLDKAIEYVKLRKPFVVNDLAMQKVLWDRRLCLRILDSMKVPTPNRIEVNRDGGPTLESAELARHVKRYSGVSLPGPEDGTGGGTRVTKTVDLIDDGDTLVVDGIPFKKPFVEKPISGEDHNVIIYFPKSHQGGGARRLFRKIGNKSSEWDPSLIVPRSITEPEKSYIYEQFLNTENSEDVKAYTVGPDYCHAETRKSPVVDGLVRRNTHGKELRYVTTLSDIEREMASRVSRGFGQRICGFDLLRSNGQSYVIDVNGWSFVKDNEHYYNTCAAILRSMFLTEKLKIGNDSTEDTPLEAPNPGISRSSTTAIMAHHPHRSALKTILKSPSISKLSAQLNHSRHYPPAGSSPKPGATTVSLSSSPSLDKPDGIQLAPAPRSMPIEDNLPPAAVSAGVAVVDSVPETEHNASAGSSEPVPALPSSKHSWKLKGVVTVIRHADRTPKQKIKFTAHSQVFVDLLKGHHEEVLLKGEAALSSVETAVKIAQQQGIEDQEKLKTLRNALAKKRNQPATKVQIKPMFKKRPKDTKDTKVAEGTEGHTAVQPKPDAHQASNTEKVETQKVEPASSPTLNEELHPVKTRSDSTGGVTFSRYAASDNDMIVEKLQLVMKWGGEPTHSARYQCQDLGSNMRDDCKLLNRRLLDDVRIFTSSEKRVKTSAQIWAGAFLGHEDIPEDYIQVRKDLLDDSNAAKDLQDKVKKKLKHLLRQGNSVPEEFAWPKDVPEPYIVMQTVVDLLRFHRRVMRHNFKKLGGNAAASLAALNDSIDGKDTKEPKETVNISSIQSRWCTGEDPELFRERWEKLFAEFCDTEKADPSKVSELYDTMKYDALHNKQFLEWVFTPSQSLLDEMAKEDAELSVDNGASCPEKSNEETGQVASTATITTSSSSTSMDKQSFVEKIGLRSRNVLPEDLEAPPYLTSLENTGNYFKLYSGSGEGRSKQDKRLDRLRELFRYAKILFDFIGPQEYGISNDEKLEIGLLTSLPLLREIVQDLEELQASEDSKFFCYFTKESHIYTLLNCIMEGGIPTKIKRSAIPELDYLSQICFELYEATDTDTQESFYSIRISISPGCHTVDPLDVSLDSKHAIGTAQRRTLTGHQDWKEVISTLKAKFDTVQLPKSFLAVNVSDKHEMDAQDIQQGARDGWRANQSHNEGQVQSGKGHPERGRSPLRPTDYEVAPDQKAKETVLEG